MNLENALCTIAEHTTGCGAHHDPWWGLWCACLIKPGGPSGGVDTMAHTTINGVLHGDTPQPVVCTTRHDVLLGWHPGPKISKKKHILKSRFDLIKVNSLHWDDHLLLMEFAYNKVIMLALRRNLLWLCIGGNVDPRWVGLKLVKWL